MGKYKIAVIPGDGIGPEIVKAGIKVLNKIAEKYNHQFEYEEVFMGGCAIDKFGEPLPDKELEKCLKSDSIILGAVGGPKWDNVETQKRPEKGLLKLRQKLEVYANLRPAKIIPILQCASPLKKEKTDNVDIMVVRELTGGIYFGDRGKTDVDAYDVEKYSVEEIRRIAKVGFDMAMIRNKKVISVDKANVLETSRLWRKIVEEVSEDYPEITLEHMYVDNMAMQLVSNPSKYDVLITSNMFGDILSDLLAAVCGSIGMLSSASLGNTKRGLYEPIHGSAPDIAGKNIANPLATISSIAMMLEISFGLTKEAKEIENAINTVLEKGYRTLDIYEGISNQTKVGTMEMAEKMIEEIK